MTKCFRRFAAFAGHHFGLMIDRTCQKQKQKSILISTYVRSSSSTNWRIEPRTSTTVHMIADCGKSPKEFTLYALEDIVFCV